MASLPRASPLEGPIKKDTASFIFSARRTYIDILARPLIKPQTDGVTAGYYFYDLNGKLNWKLGARDRLYLSGYLGYDEFYANDDTKRDNGDYYKQRSGLGWGNRIAALRWNHIVNDRLFMNTHLTYTRYQFDVGVTQDERYTYNGRPETSKFSLNYLSNIQDVSAKVGFRLRAQSPATTSASAGSTSTTSSGPARCKPPAAPTPARTRPPAAASGPTKPASTPKTT